MMRRLVMAPVSIAASGNTSWMLNTSGPRRTRWVPQPVSPIVSGGDIAITASTRPPRSEARAGERAEPGEAQRPAQEVALVVAGRRPLADGPHERHRLWVSGQCVPGRAALGGAAADAAAGARAVALSWFIFAAWQVVVLATAGRASCSGEAQGVGMGRDAGLDRSAGASSDCCWWRSTSWRRSAERRGRCTSRCGTSWRRSSGRF